ncbi:MAG: glycosyltransferase family 4 protein [Methylacidiphilales bacterium]|nr:glycosyltransferase family 4 protein [Candidatus Methylacidiphilales bacterium]
MRITIAQGAFFPVPPIRGGAVEKAWFALGREFARKGHQVTHISRHIEGQPPREVQAGVEHHRVPGFDPPRNLLKLKLYDLIYSWRVKRLLKKLPSADILVTNTFWLPILMRSKKWGRIYVHVQRFPKKQMRFYRHAARVQTVSRHVQKAILAQDPKLAGRVCTIPNPLNQRSEEFTMPLEQREKIILFVGRVHPEKGLDILLDAFAKMPSEILEAWKLYVIGPAETKYGGGGDLYLAALKRRSHEFADRVVWIGPLFNASELDHFYRRAALFVYPSLADRGEACPLAPVEAMAQGCPILVSDLECFSDVVSDGINGYRFNHLTPQPSQGLQEKLTALLYQPEKLRMAGLEAYKKAQDYSLDRIAELYLQDFASLL